MRRRTEVPDQIDPELLALIEKHIAIGCEIATVSQGHTNRVESISPAGLEISTEKSDRGDGPQLVPGWMFNVAWDELERTGRLRASDLVRVAKRSSAVCAVLAALPTVSVVSERPIELRLQQP
jgi:hypothetical protein